MTERGTIRIRNAVFYAYHGVKENEQNLGGKFEIDVDLVFDVAAAAETDSLKNTVDYEMVYDSIRKVVTDQNYYLLEALGDAMCRALLKEFLMLDNLTVRIRKPHPPVKGVVDHIEVEITRTR